jgi:Trk K+ transport system NAD-binding subunit
MPAGVPPILAFEWDDYTPWLWWFGYIAISLVGWIVARHRRVRMRIMRWLAPRLPSRLDHIAERVLFYRPLWTFIDVLSLIGLVLLFGSLLMYFFEHGRNDKFDNLEEAGHSTLVYLFSGVEDRTPKTEWGWRVVAAMILAGVGLTAYATGQVIHEIIGRRERHMERDAARECYLVIGWNTRARQIVEELFSAFELGVERHLITVLAEHKVNTSHVPELDARGVTFVAGDAHDKKVLEKLGAHEARSVIVMADTAHPDPDARVALIVLALRGLFQDKALAADVRPRVCVEVVDHRRIPLIRDAGADVTVCHEDYGLGVLTQASLSESVAEVYHELLTFRNATNDVFLLRGPGAGAGTHVPEDVWERLFEGKTFDEAAAAFTCHRGRCSNPAILIGVRRGGNLLLNPGSPVILGRADDLVVLARQVPAPEHLRQLIS